MSFCDSEYNIGKAKISELENDLASWFRSTLPPTLLEEECNKHYYNLTFATELLSGKRYKVPLVAFTLGKNDDDVYHGVRDSSGTALHNSSEMALKVARNELCERQALSLFWYYGHCLKMIELRTKDILEMSYINIPYVKYLLKRGNIYILDISLIDPIRTTLAIFLSKNGPVYYSSGAAGNEDPRVSISKALDELYQAYILMVYLSDPGASKLLTENDALNEGYVGYNNTEGYNLINNYLKSFECYHTESLQQVNFKTQFHKEKVLCFRKDVRFLNPEKNLFFVSLKSMSGFNLMSLDKSKKSTNMKAASHYGYNNMTNTGPIPFA